jgi:hypothetical protein
MPFYNYICSDCIAVEEKKIGRELTEEEQIPLVFEVFHAMFPTKKELAEKTQCPACRGHNTHTTLLETSQSFRILGGDWREFKKKNAAALQRDMALHQLENDDPYGYMRTPSEKADLADQLRSSSKKRPKRKHFLT